MQIGKLDRSTLKQGLVVWYCAFSKNVSLLPTLRRELSHDEIARANRFKFEKDRSRFVISRGILRMLLGAYLDMPPAALKFEYTSYGKPFLSDTDLKFNVSHSEDMAAFAFVEGTEVGVDIEKIKEDSDLMELARNFFSAREIAVMEKTPTTELARTFFRCWTRKESFIKAEGSGLSFPLDRFAVSLQEDHSAILEQTDWDPSEKDQWSLFSFTPHPEYIGALAIRTKGIELRYMDWDKTPT